MIKKTITEYLNEGNAGYALYTIENRAIPSVVDGFKTSQRKVLSDALEVWKNTKSPKRVYQFAGSVAFNKKFHHGNTSLEDTIVGMCQDFKNNLSLFDTDGQFGSMRLPNGVGASRYIGCSLNDLQKNIFLDNNLLEILEDEGSKVEPKYFLPIIPTVLVNGTSGIAVGFASTIFNRHPLELIETCLNYLKTGKIKGDLKPFIKNYSGDIIRDSENNLRFFFKGSFIKVNQTTVKITEYEPSMTYDKIEELLYNLVENGKIVSYENLSKDTIEINVKFRKDELEKLSEQDLRMLFKLDSSDTENLTVLDENGKLKIFSNTEDLIKHFLDFRLTFYQKRKELLLHDLERQLTIFKNKARFVELVGKKTIKINNQVKIVVIEQLVKNKFNTIDESFDYLLGMSIYSFTEEYYQKFLEGIKNVEIEIVKVLSIGEKDMYIEDLKNLQSIVKKMFKK